MKTFLENKLNITIQNLEYNGLKFFKTIKISKNFYKNLYDDGSYISRLKYKNTLKEEITECIHIKASYAYILEKIAFILIGIGIIFVLGKFPIMSTIFSLLAVFSFLTHKYLNKRTIEQKILGLDSIPMIVDMMFGLKEEALAEESSK